MQDQASVEHADLCVIGAGMAGLAAAHAAAGNAAVAPAAPPATAHSRVKPEPRGDDDDDDGGRSEAGGELHAAAMAAGRVVHRALL